MKKDEWSRLLASWASEAVERAGSIHGVAQISPLSGLGFPGAAEEALRAAETRIGHALPTSYREFLKCTNGLRQPPGVWAALGGDFWPAEQIEWFRVRNSAWTDAYTSQLSEVPDDLYFVYGREQHAFRAEYLRETLEVSHDGDSAIYLLNPKVVGDDGEWEAWFFANWEPGAFRYRSFGEMMLDHYESFREGSSNGF